MAPRTSSKRIGSGVGILALGVLLVAAAPPAARAELTLGATSVELQAKGFGATLVEGGDNGIIAFDDEVRSASGLFATSAGATVAITATDDTLTIVANGDTFLDPSGNNGALGLSELKVGFCTTAAAHFNVTLDLEADATSSGSLVASYEGPGTDDAIVATDDDAGPVHRDLEGDLEPGACPLVEVFAALDISAFSSGLTASWTLALTVTSGTEGDAILWKGPREGAFAEPGNWDPAVVPGENDTALFKRDTATVDVGGIAAGGCAAPARTIGAVRLDDADLELTGGALALSDTALEPPSLALRNRSELRVAGSGICAQSAAVGVAGRDSTLSVEDGGLLEVAGRFSIAQGGDGAFSAGDGAVVKSVESRIGDGVGFGFAQVSDATWESGNLAVGLESSGQLFISQAGRVESAQAFVDRNLAANEDALVTIVNGVDDAPTTWHVGSLEIGGRGTVEVRKAGLLETELTDDVLNGEVVLGNALHGEATLKIQGGGTADVAADLSVGENGRGRLELVSDADGPARLEAAALILGRGDDATSAGLATVDDRAGVDGDEVVTQTLRVPDGAFAHGFLLIGPRGGVRTSGAAGIGAGGGNGIVGVLGDDGVAPALTRWSVGQAIIVGAPDDGPENGVLGIADGMVAVGSLGTPGTVLVQKRGAVNALGTPGRNILALAGGVITNHGAIRGPLTIDGRYDPDSTGTLVRELGDVEGGAARMAARSPAGAVLALAQRARPQAPVFNAGPIVFTGDAELGGKLVLAFRGGAAPKQGDAIRVLEVAGDVIGDFAEVAAEGLAPGATFDATVAGGALTLVSLTDTTALPVVTLKAKAKVKETKRGGTKIKVLRGGDRSTALAVGYKVGGTAQSGADFEALSGFVEIPAGKKSATILVRPIADGAFEPAETIEVELLPGDGYSVGFASRVSIALASKDR
jgi:hypothetical protein